MDPNTGKFHHMDKDKVTAIPDNSRYSIGDVYELNGYEFEITRINKSSIVLSPVLKDGEVSRRRKLQEIQQ